MTSSTLEILKIQDTHDGNYTCRVSNPFGSDSFTARLETECKNNSCSRTLSNSDSPAPVTWIEEPQDVKISGNAVHVVRCSAKGNPRPKIIWKKISGQFLITINLILIIVLNSGGSKQLLSTSQELKLNQMKKEDSSEYECTAENGVGPSLTKRISVSVTGRVWHIQNFRFFSSFWGSFCPKRGARVSFEVCLSVYRKVQCWLRKWSRWFWSLFWFRSQIKFYRLVSSSMPCFDVH